MVGKYFISTDGVNYTDSWMAYGSLLSDESIDRLLLPAPPKPATENKSETQNGKQVILSNLVDEREVQLFFSIDCISIDDYLVKYKSLTTNLNSGILFFKVPFLKTIYKLYVVTYMELLTGNGVRSGKFIVRFCEPNPANRIEL